MSTCDVCKAQDKPMSLCSTCKRAQYCSDKCQLRAWEHGHEEECDKLIGEVMERGQKLQFYRTLMKEYILETVEYAYATRNNNNEGRKYALSEITRNIDLWGSVINTNYRTEDSIDHGLLIDEGKELAGLLTQHLKELRRFADGILINSKDIGMTKLIHNGDDIMKFFRSLKPYSIRLPEIADAWERYLIYTREYIFDLGEGESWARSAQFYISMRKCLRAGEEFGSLLDSTLLRRVSFSSP